LRGEKPRLLAQDDIPLGYAQTPGHVMEGMQSQAAAKMDAILTIGQGRRKKA
jgi:hypothetical protein